jgi:glycerophosphoryl diester phosphodiesterase
MAMKNVIGFFLGCSLMVSCQNMEKGNHEKQTAPGQTHEAEDASISFDAWFTDPQPLVSAHRGGPYPGYPENAIETFQHIANQIPFVSIECDVSMTKDSVLVLMHDKTLDRTTTGSGKVSAADYEALEELLLIDNEGDTTGYRIPTLKEALEWGRDQVLFTLDVKRGVPFDKVMAMVAAHDATDYAAIITYRIDDAKLIYEANPDIIISVSAGDEGAIAQIIESGIPAWNLLGFVGTSEPDASHYATLDSLGIKTILGTLGNLDRSAAAKNNDDVYRVYVKNGADIIATDRTLKVADVLYQN